MINALNLVFDIINKRIFENQWDNAGENNMLSNINISINELQFNLKIINKVFIKIKKDFFQKKELRRRTFLNLFESNN